MLIQYIHSTHYRLGGTNMLYVETMIYNKNLFNIFVLKNIKLFFIKKFKYSYIIYIKIKNIFELKNNLFKYNFILKIYYYII